MCQAYDAEFRLMRRIERKYGSMRSFLDGGPVCECPDWPEVVDNQGCPVHGKGLRAKLEEMEEWACVT